MTRGHPSSPSLRTTPLILILIAFPLLACSLTGKLSGLLPGGEMSVDEALAVEPDDGRPTLLEEMGPPDAFSITFDELEGQTVRWESWSYFDYNSQFDFIDGEPLWTVELEDVPDGSVYAHWYDPLDFKGGMSRSEVEALLSDQELLEVNLDAVDLEGGLVLAGDQITLAFQNDQLFYVETFILSPDQAGDSLAAVPPAAAGETPEIEPTLEPTQEPTLTTTPQPTLEPTAEPTASGPLQFQDDFESETPLAVPLFASSVMEYGNIDGQGVLTAHQGGILLAYYPDEPVLKDFSLAMDMRPLNFVKGAEAGIVFRAENPEAGSDYYFLLTFLPVDQRVTLRAWVGGEWALTDSQAIPADLVPQYGVYRIRVDCQGDDIKVFLSDQLAAEFSSSLLPDPGYFGLIIISSRDPETVTFDNLVISEVP